MSYFVGGAMIVSAVGGAISSKRAADKNAEGVNKGLKQSAALANQARSDVISLFDNSAKKANIGIQEALNFYKQNAQKRLSPYVQANQQAQNVIGIGAQQANNAILGLPVDMNQITAQQQPVQSDYSGIMGAVAPQVKTFADIEAEKAAAQPTTPTPTQQKQQGGSKTDALLTGGGILAHPKDMLNPVKAATNPLGLGDKITSKSPGHKLLKKLF